jgi:hypothetical protein
MTIASGSRHSMAYSAETVYGVTDNSPTFKPLRHKSTTLALSKSSFQSQELRTDRQISDFRHGTKQVGGDIAVELSSQSFDDILQAVMCGTWAAKATKTATTLSAQASDNSYNDSGNGFVTAGFEVGDVVVVTGFTGNVANNIASGVLTSVAAGKIVVGGTDGDVIVDDAAGESVTIATISDKLSTGTTRRSFTIERLFADLTQYRRYKGCEFTKMSLSVKPEGIVEVTFGVLGQSEAPDTAILSGETYSSATTTSPFDGFSGSISEGGSDIAVVTEVSLDLDNGLQALFVVGSPETIQPSIGRSNVTGSVTAYFQNTTLLNKFINETESSLSFVIGDGTNTLTFIVPRLKYTGGQPDVGGEGPVTLTMPFQALLDSTTGTNLKIIRSN